MKQFCHCKQFKLLRGSDENIEEWMGHIGMKANESDYKEH